MRRSLGGPAWSVLTGAAYAKESARGDTKCEHCVPSRWNAFAANDAPAAARANSDPGGSTT
jgi:hypothetical protein